MNVSNLDLFLDSVLFDSEDGGTPIPERPGFVRYVRPPLSEEDLVIRQYTEDGYNRPGVMNYDEHGAAYVSATAAALQLRSYWRESRHFFMEGPPEVVLGGMAKDVQEVIDRLVNLRNALSQMQRGERELRRDLDSSRDSSKKAKDNARLAISRQNLAEAEYQNSIQALELFQILSEGPVEQLARVGQDNNTHTDEGA